MASSQPEIKTQIAEFNARYGNDEASLATLLCDRHDPDAQAFRILTDNGASEISFCELMTELRRTELSAAT